MLRTIFVGLFLAAAGEDEAVELAARVERHIARLASDAMEGRAPGTPGGERAARYIASELEALGLETSLQPVPLLGHRARVTEDVVVVDGARKLPRESYALSSASATERIEVEGRLLFGGYGVALGDADLEGRLVAVLPGVPEHFPGGASGFLSRDAAKLDALRERGALGVVFLREDVASFRERLRFERLTSGGSDATGLEVRLDVVASELVEPERLEELRELAHGGAVEPVTLERHLRVAHRQQTRRFAAPNVVAILPGRDPGAGVVLVTAHYDAYGVGPPDEDGDAIYNGALDNAAGTAALLELARHFATREPRTRRTIVFVATTAEEHGALGMAYYVERPARPLDETVVALNLDGLNVYGVTDDFFVFPSEGTDANPALRAIGEEVGMRLARESWQDGMHFGFDTKAVFPHGIVGLTLWQGSDYRGLSSEDARARRTRFGPIHTPSDEWPGSGDPEAIAQHVALYVEAIEHWAGDAAAPSLDPSGPLARPDEAGFAGARARD